jgi:hypothetical protein
VIRSAMLLLQEEIKAWSWTKWNEFLMHSQNIKIYKIANE